MSERVVPGGRTFDTIESIRSRQLAEHAAAVKAENPSTLIEADLRALPGDVISELMSEGKLGHLGLGGRRKGRRR
jgi:hypothetical protein